MDFKIKEDSLFAKLGAWKLKTSRMAMTLGNTIHLYNTSTTEFLEDTRWVRHELKHIEQFRKYGFLRFLFLYTLETIRKGYSNNRFEKEAREAEKSVEAVEA